MKKGLILLGGFYKLISWDFGVVFEQIAVQNEMKSSSGTR